MTLWATICQALLKGRTLSQMDGFRNFGCTNISREISRGVEKKFNVRVDKTRVDFVSRYNKKKGYYFKYKLDVLKESNREGVQKMIEYVEENGGVVAVVEKNKVGRPTNESKIITNNPQLNQEKLF